MRTTYELAEGLGLQSRSTIAITFPRSKVFTPNKIEFTSIILKVRSARPDQQGQYQVKGLPAGEYLAVAVEYVQEGMWNDPDYLEGLRRYSQRFSLTEGDARSLSLKLVNVEAQ